MPTVHQKQHPARWVGCDIAVDATGYLFRTTAPKSGALTEKPMHQQDAYRLI
jgi:hypothetical protein